MTDLRQALAQEEKPPVKSYCGGKPNYCTPEVTPDVDAVNISQERVDEMAKGKREWVRLTDEEIEELAKWADKHAAPWHLGFARAVEAKLKEKNS
jgi:Holliday junction resolvase